MRSKQRFVYIYLYLFRKNGRFITPEIVENLLVIIFTGSFHDKCSFNITHRKENCDTISIVLLFMDHFIMYNFTVIMKIIHFVFSTFKVSLLSFNHVFTLSNLLLINIDLF